MDTIRGITNHSSGKMGFAVARAAREAGAQVTLVAGPVHLPTPRGVRRVDVQSARDMLQAVQASVGEADVFVATAAVADWPDDRLRAHILMDLIRAPAAPAIFVRTPPGGGGGGATEAAATEATTELGTFGVVLADAGGGVVSSAVGGHPLRCPGPIRGGGGWS